MNLKEAFRYQNYLNDLFSQMKFYAADRRNFLIVKQEHFRSKVNPEAVDETIETTKEREYTQDNKTIISFMSALIEEKHRLSIAIDKAKAACEIDIDAETAHNNKRRDMALLLKTIAGIKPSERKTTGRDFKFNANGEQVEYCYEINEVSTIDFDRNAVKGLFRKLSRESDDMSAKIDRCMIDVIVEFEPMFDVSDSVEDALCDYEEKLRIERKAV